MVFWANVAKGWSVAALLLAPAPLLSTSEPAWAVVPTVTVAPWTPRVPLNVGLLTIASVFALIPPPAVPVKLPVKLPVPLKPIEVLPWAAVPTLEP